MFRRSLAVLAIALVLLPGCGKKDPKIYSQDGPVADGDILIESCIGDAKNLNPPLVDENTGGDIDGLVFNGLLRYNEKLELEPCLAEKWTVSKSGKVITYYLRKGVKFHDGVEFTANDVLFTYKVYSDPTVNTPYGSFYQYIKSVEILDPYIVKVTYKKPFAPALSSTFDNILPKHLLEGKDINHDEDFNRHPVGTGPYKFVEWKTDQQIVLEANPDYWEGKPHVHRYILRIIPDQSAELLSLLKGETDAIGAWTSGSAMTPEQYNLQTNNSRFTDYFNKYKSSEFQFYYIGWNCASPFFKDAKVRRALTMAIDRQAIIQNVIYGLGSPCTGPFIPGTWAYNNDVKPIPFDLEQSKKLLKEVGWKPGTDGLLHKTIDGQDTPFRFKIYTNQGNVLRERIATIVQQQLKEIGIDCQPQIVEWTTLLSQYIDKRKYDAMIMGWGFGPEPDCYLSWHSSQTGEHQYNLVNYKNKTVDSLLVEGRTTLDPAKRAKIYHQIHRILSDDVAATFLFVPNQLSALHKRFKGFEVTSYGIGIHPERWYVPLSQQKYQQ